MNPSHFSQKLRAVGTFALAGVLCGCGYHALTSGKSSHLPETVRTIAIPEFDNKTATYHIDHMLTEAVVREFEQRTKYRIVLRGDDSDADAVLKGTVLSTSTAPLTYDSVTGRLSSALVTVNMSVALTDRHGRVLYENPAYVFREQYQLSREISSFFQEDTPALQRLSRDFGRELVADIMESF